MRKRDEKKKKKNNRISKISILTNIPYQYSTKDCTSTYKCKPIVLYIAIGGRALAWCTKRTNETGKGAEPIQQTTGFTTLLWEH